MAACIKCEKCGKVTAPHEARHIRVHKLADAMNFKNKAEDNFDLCISCYNILAETLVHKEKDK